MDGVSFFNFKNLKWLISHHFEDLLAFDISLFSPREINDQVHVGLRYFNKFWKYISDGIWPRGSVWSLLLVFDLEKRVHCY